MFEPEALGLGSSQYQQFAASLVTPALGFVFLFLLGLQLKKLPFVDALQDYKPPAWVLPTFAVGSLFSLSLFIFITFFLNFMRASPSIDDAINTFSKVRPIKVESNYGELQYAAFTLSDYDGSSNFRIIVNGYRMFGSSSDCMLSYQCKAQTSATVPIFNEAQKIPIKDNSIYHIHSLNVLPVTREIKDHLVSNNSNFIDIFSENSGLGDCRLNVLFSYSFANQSMTYRVIINSEIGEEILTKTGYDTVNTFFSKGPKVGVDTDQVQLIPVYKTLSSEVTNRVCERIRLQLDLSKIDICGETQSWEKWVFDRHRSELCDIVNNARPHCPYP